MNGQGGPTIQANELFEAIGRLTWERDMLVRKVQELEAKLKEKAVDSENL